MQLVLVREATLHYRSEGFCRSTVIPSEGVSPTRNPLLPTRNGGDCTLAWREILQGKAFQNDIALRGRNTWQEILRGFTPQNDNRFIPKR